MLKYIARRLVEVIPTTFGIILLTFVLFNVIGGSPAQVILGKNATAESIAAFNHKYGYDLPLPKQFVKFCTDLAHGDFGLSTEADEPVIDVLKRGVGPSLSLTVPILFGGTAVGLMLALLCEAGRGGAFDRAVLVGSTVLMSVNYVVWVLAGQFIFAFKLRLFPVWGYENAFYLVLPVIIGIVSGLGVDVRFFRTAILDEIYKPYVRTARMKGLSVSLAIPYLFTGSLMLESFFGIPGLGNVSINAIHSSDMAVVRAVVVLGALLYQGVNLATDLLYAWLDPRVRLG